MPTSPGSCLGDKPLYFRAPPPSPVATGSRSSFANDSVLAEFLRQSLKVPELVLPDKVIPKQRADETPPIIDLKWFNSPENDANVLELIKSVGRIGCIELINHGISDDLIKVVMDECRGIFVLSRKEKDSMKKAAEKVYGFEEFVWGRDKELMLKLEPGGYVNFSAKMEILSSSIEKVASEIFQHLEQHNDWTMGKARTQAVDSLRSVSCIYTHSNLEPTTLDEWACTLRYDAIRMLIRGSDYSHVLGIHIHDGCSEFHIYSKKGWASFVPQENALVITLGDHTQAWSGGVHKHVIRKPIFKGDHSDHISMAFLFQSPSPHPTKKQKLGDDVDDTIIITIGQQLYFAILVTLAYQFLVCFCSLF
ncbi:hypothetical protein QQ045_032638 [Rhodiola kirilowii]